MTVLHTKGKLREWAEAYNCVLVNKDRIKNLQFNIEVEVPTATEHYEYVDARITATIAHEITKVLCEQQTVLIKRTARDSDAHVGYAELRYEIDVIIPKDEAQSTAEMSTELPLHKRSWEVAESILPFSERHELAPVASEIEKALVVAHEEGWRLGFDTGRGK